MNGVQTRFKCKLDVKRCKRFVFPPSSLLPRSNALKTKAIRYFQTDRTLTRIVSPPLQIRQSLTIDDNSGQPESGIEKSDTFTPEKKTEPVLRVHEPLDKNTKFPEVPALFQKLNYPEIDYMQEPSPSSGEEKEEIPERYEITGYVQRSNPHRATGVTFDDMDMIEKAMASDELTEAEQEQARQTFQKLEGTNMERVLQASVLGSSDKLKRYMRLYVDRGEPHLLTGKNRDDILREFDITEHVPQ